jgi:hypothetical protein
VLGVLKKETVVFEPPLPKNKRAAIQAQVLLLRLRMLTYAHICSLSREHTADLC